MPQKALRAEPPADLERVYASVSASSMAEEDEVVICVSKMISVMANTLPPEASGRTGGGEVFLAFGRVFSGVVHPGQRLYVLSDAFDPRCGGRRCSHASDQRVVVQVFECGPHKVVWVLRAASRAPDGPWGTSSAPEEGGYQEVYISDLFLMMGRGLELMDSVAAGNVLAIGGLEKTILKSATLSSTLNCRPFASMMFQARRPCRSAPLPHHRACPSCALFVQASPSDAVLPAGDPHRASGLATEECERSAAAGGGTAPTEPGGRVRGGDGANQRRARARCRR